MNPIQKTINARLDGLPAELAPLQAAALRYLRYCSAIDVHDAMLVAHRPWDGPLSYLIRLFPGAKKAWFPKYQKAASLKIPPVYQRLLMASNGCFAFGMSLYGMPPSMLQNPPLLDRSRLQCHDLGTANRHWKSEYAMDPGFFHFGCRQYSDELAGYFMDGGHRIHAITQGGQAVGEWPTLTAFLQDELAASEKLSCAGVPKDWWH